MVSRRLARRALLLGLWVGGILLLLDIREPGFWREAFGLARQVGEKQVEKLEEALSPTAVPVARATSAAVASGAVSATGVAAAPTAPAAAPPSDAAEVVTTDAAYAAAPTVAVAPTPAPEAVALAVATPAQADVAANDARAARPGPAPSRPSSVAATSGTSSARADAALTKGLYARVSEAWRLNGTGDHTTAWTLVRKLPENTSDPQILRLKALTALWAHENDEALRLATAWSAREPDAAEPRLALAQAELQSDDVTTARVTLGALAARPLDVDQTMQLAILQDWAGDRDGAIASCSAVLERRPDDVQALTRLSRLLESDGQDARARDTLVRARAVAPDEAELELLQARVAAKLGDRQAANAGYAEYLRRHPADVDGRLEAARHAVNAGEPDLAVERYQSVIGERGPDGLRLEMARALLAADRYEEGETWARDATESNEDGPEARLALAQSVYLQGRPRDAAPLFADARDAAARQRVDASYDARLAMAQDQDLNAYGLLGDQIEGGAPPEPASAATPADLWLLRGNVAQKRGDFRRARDAYQRAAELGAPLRAEVALERLDVATRPEAGAGYAFFADANGLEVNGGALWAEMRPGDRALVTVKALAQVVTQHEARYTRTGGSVGVSEWFVTPEWSLDGSFGFINSSAGGGDIVTGSVGARRYFSGGSVLGIEGYREPLLGGHEDLDPRLWNRIIDLEALGPSFAVNGGKAFGDWLLSEARRDRVWAQVGAENYEDGNLRGIFYAHYQMPLRNGPANWTVIRPNAFVEAFKNPDQPEYFSPSTHATLGVAGHTVVQHGRYRLEAELNPQLLVTNGNPGFGAHALLDASVQLGPANVGISGFAFYDSEDAYWLARAMAHVEVVF